MSAMPRLICSLLAAFLLIAAVVCPPVTAAGEEEAGFVSLFDGKTLDGWTPQDDSTASAFKVEDGAIVCNGPFTHLFYSGPVNGASFKNFELRFEFKPSPRSNSGVFFHTENPGGKSKVTKGYECQICGDSYAKDPRKTGSLYDIEDLKQSAAPDDAWSTYAIRVDGKRIVLQVNGKTTVDYTERDPPNRKKGREGRVLSRGTFALQAHDPVSKVAFRNIRVKVLPD
jgi:hypothetical protein